MREKNISFILILIMAAMVATGCPRRGPKDPTDKQASPPVVVDQAAPDIAKEPPPMPEPIQAPYGPVETLGAAFCKSLIAGDYEGLASHFDTAFLLKVNSKFQDLEDKDALLDMQGLTPKVIEDSIRAAHTVPASECVVETTELRNCADTAMLANDSTNGDVTSDSFLAAVAEMDITECGILQIRETSNAGILYSQIITGNPGGEWKLLLGM